MSDGAMMSHPARAWTTAWPGQCFDGFVVENPAVPDQPVVAVGIVGIEGDVAHDADFRVLVLERLDGAANQVVRVIGLGRVGGLEIVFDVRKQRDGGNAQILGLGGGGDKLVDGKPVDAWHRWDRLALAGPLGDENRPDQVAGGEAAFRHQGPRPRMLTGAAHTGAGISAKGFPVPGSVIGVFQGFRLSFPAPEGRLRTFAINGFES